MNSIASYFSSYIKESVSFPDHYSEDYRYSLVIKKISMLDVQSSSGKIIDLPWTSDYVFYADHVSNTLNLKTFTELPVFYHRYKDYFKQMSLAKNKQFYCIDIEKDKIELSFVATEGSVMSDKVYIRVPASQKVQIFLKFYTELESLSIPMIYVDAQENTCVEIIYDIDPESNKGVIAPLFELGAQEKSHVSLQSLTTGVLHHRLSVIGYCLGLASHIDLRTGFHLKNQETCDLLVRIFHEAKDSTSNQMIKAVTFDASRMNFNGQIYANKDAKNIYAYQMLKGMILGDDAQIMARPQLDIEYYELACSHGVSIGGFDPEELFYLRSRGIKEEDVYPLLLYGFFVDPFVGLPLEQYWMSHIKSVLAMESI